MELESASRDFDEAIQVAPRFAPAYLARGNFRMDRGETSVENRSTALRCVLQARHAHLDLGELDLALSDYDKAIELDPQDAVAYFNRSLAHDRLGHRARSQQDRSRALELNPRLGEAASR
jgi:tetratricopeptide (TPR) repeat protein